jgi:hypothetical protein
MLSRFFVGDDEYSLDRLRESVKNYQLYLICDVLGNYLSPTDPNMIKLLKSFDAVSADDMRANNYGDPSTRVDFMNYIEKTLELWNSYVKAYGHDIIPLINPR